MKTNKGFTLIEVMVAVAIIAVALPAIIIAILGKLDALMYMTEKRDAQMVAHNIQQELLIRNRLNGKIPEKESGKVKMGLREWYWQTEFKAYPQEEFKGLFAVEVKVWSVDENAKAYSDRSPLTIYFSALYENQDTTSIELEIEPYPVKRKEKTKNE